MKGYLGCGCLSAGMNDTSSNNGSPCTALQKTTQDQGWLKKIENEISKHPGWLVAGTLVVLGITYKIGEKNARRAR